MLDEALDPRAVTGDRDGGNPLLAVGERIIRAREQAGACRGGRRRTPKLRERFLAPRSGPLQRNLRPPVQAAAVHDGYRAGCARAEPHSGRQATLLLLAVPDLARAHLHLGPAGHELARRLRWRPACVVPCAAAPEARAAPRPQPRAAAEHGGAARRWLLRPACGAGWRRRG